MVRDNLQKRLSDTREEVVRAREQLRITEEQVAYQHGVADEAATNAVVAETPLASRDHREASGDLQRLVRQRDELRRRVAALAAEQDDLLDRLLMTDGDG